MGTWVNGASVNRERKRELPRSAPGGADSIVQDTIARAVVAEHEARIRSSAVGFLDKFVALFAGYSHRTNLSHKRKPAAQSTRAGAQIVAEVNSFYTRRPRPWRWHGAR
jgi:hypothetical protein